MTTVTYETHIDRPVADVWAALADFGNVYRFNPAVPTSRLTSSDPVGLGSTRHCDLNVPGASIEERIIEWTEGASYTIEIYESRRTPPAAFVTARIGVSPDGDGAIARMELEYELRGGVIGAALDALMVRNQYEKTVSGMLDGLKHFLETGLEVEHFRDIEHHTAVAV